MTKIYRVYDEELKKDRARDLEINGKNGIERIIVTLHTSADPAYALLDVEFYNYLYLGAILDRINNQGVPPGEVFTISGGVRIIAGDKAGEVQVKGVTSGSAGHILQLKVEPIGDYSTYTLEAIHSDAVLDNNGNPVLDGNGNPVLESKIDPLFASADFKFRPGCFNSNCAPITGYEAPEPEPVIDYLAKDFDSFKHVLINAMRARVPDWQPTSEADFDQVLIDLIAADADELSDYQDRVMNEAYLGRARKRVSLARHARLMDYHIHQGNQASTLVALKVKADASIPKGFGVWTSKKWQDKEAVIFTGVHKQECYKALNELSLYTWGGVVTALEAGSTDADIVPTAGTTKADAENLRDLLLRKGLDEDYRSILRQNGVMALVIEEELNPETGSANGRNMTGRQVLHLQDGDSAAEVIHDPVEDKWVVRVRWRQQDKLKRRYCFVTRCPGETEKENVTLFHGNLIRVTHGRPYITRFHPPGTPLGLVDDSQFECSDQAYYEYPPDARWGTICPLPNAPLAYQNTPVGGDTPPSSTLTVKVSGFDDPWDEQIDLIESKSDDTHFIVETDEYSRSLIRFGNNVNGRALPQNAMVTCYYQVGRGSLGNVGADSLTGFDDSATGYPDVEKVWNPLDVTDGRDPEKPAEIIRRVPQAYRAHQLRAVIPDDYVRRAEELTGVSHAFAHYAWTGSWRTVHIAIDPKGSTVLDDKLRNELTRHLDAVRLIGEDLEVHGARYVPLDIRLKVCADPDFWPEALAFELEAEFSNGYTADGRMGFFHPDLWTFGQPLYASQLVGRALVVRGIERVLLVSIRRWHVGRSKRASIINIKPEDLPLNEIAILQVEPYEIIQVENDPSQMEKGMIQFEILGGRR
jgi:hypothetical protein